LKDLKKATNFIA